MKLAIDVHYSEQTALAAGVVFKNWTDDHPANEVTAKISKIEPYVPGQFFKRELPCILSLLDRVNSPIDTIVVDGFVWLSNELNPKPGLGAHLYEALNREIAVIGVAKKEFAGSGALMLLRGESKRPLFISAAGVEAQDAIHFINQMHGKHRIPKLLKRVDELSRS